MIGMILWFSLAARLKAPDPYLGFGFNPFPHEYGYEATTEDLEEGELPPRISSRRKFYQIGFPFQVRKLDFGKVENLRLVFSPEFETDWNILIFQGVFVLEQDLPFRSYRSIPEGIFWGLGFGGHLGWMMDKKDYAVNGELLNESDQLSLGGVLKGYAGPSFYLNDKMSLRVRFGLDLPFGKIGPYTTETNNKYLGTVLFIQSQLVFR